MGRAAVAALGGLGGGRGAVAYPRERAVQDPSRLGSGWEAGGLLFVALALVSAGLVMVYSASAVMAQSQGLVPHHFLLRQMTGAVAGLVVLALMAQLDYRRLRVLAWPLLAATVAVLVVMVLPGTESLAPRVNGARRWLFFGPVGVQPSEAAKLVLIIWTAALVVKKQDRLRSLSRGLLPFLMVWGMVALLILAQPNLSTALLTLLLAALVAYAGGARPGHFVMLGLAAAPFVWTQVTEVGYRMARIRTFLDPGADVVDLGYQVNQSLIALGSGGPLGVGFGRGQQKFGFLPEPHNDFILAMIGEEWGFLGVAGVVVLFTALALVGYRVARGAADLFGFLLAVGVTNLLVVQAFLHIAVNLALVPPTGVTLPLVSYGRSSMIVSLAAVGILMSVARISDRRDRALARARGIGG
ncbi:MAG TPA: putative lipid II flippase FtsW [Longimicrobiales bacterium]|nr:putative lipid II flippase FtsW [Longimicrobiales bacterium]